MRAAIYARYSSERQSETSLDDQIRRALLDWLAATLAAELRAPNGLIVAGCGAAWPGAARQGSARLGMQCICLRIL